MQLLAKSRPFSGKSAWAGPGFSSTPTHTARDAGRGVRDRKRRSFSAGPLRSAAAHGPGRRCGGRSRRGSAEDLGEQVIWPVSQRSSSALWSLLRADGASGRSPRRVQCHGGANERLQRLFINLVALMEIDGTPGVAFEAGVEEARRVLQRGALGEGHLHDILVRLTGADYSGVRPHGDPAPLPLLDHLVVGLLDEKSNPSERLAPPITQLLDSRIDQARGRGSSCSFLRAALCLHGCCPSPRPRSSLGPKWTLGSSDLIVASHWLLTFVRRAIRWLASPTRRPELRRVRPRGCRGSARPCAWTRRREQDAAMCRGRRSL